MTQLVRQTLAISVTIIAVILLLLAIYTVRTILLIAVIGVGIGVIIAPTMDFLHRKLRLPHGIGVVLMLAVWFGVILGLGYLVYILAANEFIPLIHQLPRALNAGQNRLADLLRRFPSFSSALRKANLGAMFQHTVGTVLTGVKAGVTFFALLLYLIAVSLYLATGTSRYERGILSLIPKRRQEKLKPLLARCASALRQWFVAQLIAMGCVGALATIGFVIIGVPYWPLLGVLTGVLDIIPFVGPTIAAACAVLVTLGADASKVPWVLLNFVIVEHIESNLVIPLVMRGNVDLPPIQLLTFMLILGDWFGILGVLAAPPILTVLRTIYLAVYVPSINADHPQVKPGKAA